MNRKIIIVSKNEAEGTSISDIKNPLFLTEIATELVITRLALISMLNEGAVFKNDIVVTVFERKCLYTNIFNNVITWAEFKSEYDSYKNFEIIDLLSHNMFESLAGGTVESRAIPYLPFYRNWERDREEILNVDYGIEDGYYHTENSFVGIVIRTRLAWDEKNLPKSYWDDVIRDFNSKNVNVFVFGKETEIYEQEHKNVTHVKNFQDWCRLVKNKNCRNVISTITGGTYPALIFGHSKITLTIIDNLNLVDIYGYDPSWYNDCINFANLKKKIIAKIPEPSELTEDFLKGL